MTSTSSALRLVRNDAYTLPHELPDILKQIGNTPLIELRSVGGSLPQRVRVFAKAEHLNPSGSVKDRAALRMVVDGMRSGRFRKGQTLLDASSGNTGIAYSMIAAAWGFPVTVVLPENASEGRKALLSSYGARLVFTDRMEGTDGAQHVAREMVVRSPEKYFYPDQYNNDSNWQAHYFATGPEILQQTDRRITHFVAALGTTGTFTGVTRRVKETLPDVQCIAVQPDSPLHGIEGMKHMETALVPGIFDRTLLDAQVEVSFEDAVAMARRLALEEGLFVGVSAGANVTSALRVAQNLDEGLVVTVLCDSGNRYGRELFSQENRDRE